MIIIIIIIIIYWLINWFLFIYLKGCLRYF